MSSHKLTSEDEVDDSAPDVVGLVGGEDDEHRHEESGVPQVNAAHDKGPGPTDATAGGPCGHVQYALTPACPNYAPLVLISGDSWRSCADLIATAWGHVQRLLRPDAAGLDVGSMTLPSLSCFVEHTCSSRTAIIPLHLKLHKHDYIKPLSRYLAHVQQSMTPGIVMAL